ncbi:MAG TPA: LapA family protein [Methyloprofundus sp.]|jgi:Protein of unknown function (DUF1049).|uniref:LapA family protein n=1 Tax=Methyloprofundus sp. TaxID=2020875 RepID=UPI0017F1DE17|nr:LapA family protein [Methyloprofundus sp.]HIG64819.1 LapA family protein [Methyloprofundus sp.]HIL78323.1 LapA family protein [Methylococcales bacterium]
MRIIVPVFFSLIALVALVFSLRNFQNVDIDFYFMTIHMPLALALTLELCVGIFIGFLGTFMHVIKLKSQYKLLDKKTRNTLRSDPE